MKQYWIAQGLRKQQNQFAFLKIGCGVLLTISPVVLYVVGYATATSTFNAIWRMLTIFGILWFMVPAVELWKTRKTRIIITHETITFVSLGIEVQTAWNKTERIRNVMNPVYESLWLDGPVMPKSAWWVRLLHLGQPRQEIPLSIFDWRNTGLEQDIQKYAPHLFAKNTISNDMGKDK